MDNEANTLDVTCFTCNSENETITACEELQDNFLQDNLCFSSDQQEFYVLNVVDAEEDFLKCNIQNESNYTQTLVLPQEYMKDKTLAKIKESLDEFLQCRLEMGVYGILGAEDFPEFEFVSAQTHNVTWESMTGYTVVADVTIRCNDKCSNGAFCRDIETHYNGELTCVTMHHCSMSRGRRNLDSIRIDYDLEFLTGGKFESYSDQYKKDMESRLERNFEDYIECRFKDDRRSGNAFGVYGYINKNIFELFCRSDCGTIPYCDALRLKRKEDSKDDLCFEKWIGVGEDERVNINYDYELDYETNNAGGTESFSYSVQTAASDPISREYYGNLIPQDQPELDTDKEEDQKQNLEELMDGFGFVQEFDYPSLCTAMNKHVTCDLRNRIVKIDVEIPNGGFKAPTIKEKFGDHLDGLALGITVNDPFDFPGNHFFSMTKLDQLILRARGKMQGSLDSKIGDMTNLAYLDLNQCPMLENDHKGITGAIPTEIGSVPLMVVDMGCNKLSGEIPDEFYVNIFGAEKDYGIIKLNDNNLQGTISGTRINKMKGLNQLSLARNKFSGNFPDMISLKDLQFLDLQGNRDVNVNCNEGTGNKGFTGDLPKLFKQPGTNLEVLSLNDNCFTGNLYNKCRRLTNLKYLNLKNNDLTGTIPSQLDQLKNLKYLFLQGNPQLNKTVHPNLQKFLNESGVIHDLY